MPLETDGAETNGVKERSSTGEKKLSGASEKDETALTADTGVDASTSPEAAGSRRSARAAATVADEGNREVATDDVGQRGLDDAAAEEEEEPLLVRKFPSVGRPSQALRPAMLGLDGLRNELLRVQVSGNEL